MTWDGEREADGAGGEGGGVRPPDSPTRQRDGCRQVTSFCFAGENAGGKWGVVLPQKPHATRRTTNGGEQFELVGRKLFEIKFNLQG